MKNNTVVKSINLLTIILFALAILVPMVIGIIDKDKPYSHVEKRQLIQLPKAVNTLAKLHKFPQEFNDYYSDQFGMRIWFTKQYKRLKFLLGDSPSKEITLGKDGWIFLGSIHSPKKNSGIINDYRNVNLYSELRLKKTAIYLEGLRLWLKKQNIEYLFFIAPNKHSIYPEKLPNYIKQLSEQSATDQLYNYLQKHTNVEFVNLSKPLIKAKQANQIYYKKDTHWNYIGSNIVQFAVFNKLKSMFGKLVTPTLYPMENQVTRGGDLVGIMGPYIYSKSGEPYYKSDPQPIFNNSCNLTYTPKNHKIRDVHTSYCKNKNLSALIYRDSFFTRLEPFFSQQLKYATYVFEKSNYNSLVQQLKINKPNIVIEEWVERDLPFSPVDYHIFFNFLKQYRFDASNKVLFVNNWQAFKYSPHTKVVSQDLNKLKIKTNDNDTQLIFPKLALNPTSSYVIKINLSSSHDTKLQLFYSSNIKSKRRFTPTRSTSLNLNKGNNNIYLLLEDNNLGTYLRLDPTDKKGTIEFNLIELREISPLLSRKD